MLSSLAVWTGLEPATPCVTGRYSNQLNYHTVLADLRCKDSISFPSLQISPIFTSQLHEETIAQGYFFTACTLLLQTSQPKDFDFRGKKVQAVKKWACAMAPYIGIWYVGRAILGWQRKLYSFVT